ncbi:MAG: hypothetical protein KZQ70_14565, partial [gamma proteobacterium symbiont of Lucinoma myriamae]|nr:hypothetical protein [gamma proteobacterium symbiont of Lucinoma myriamae]
MAGKRQRKEDGVQTLDLAVGEHESDPTNKTGNRFVDFEAILKGTDAFDKAPTTETNLADKSLDFGSLLGSNEVEVMRCGGDDVSVHIPEMIKEKIWKNQFINLNILLKGNVELHEICSGGTLKIGENGTLEKQPKLTKEKVPNIEKWSDAFLIFMFIYLRKHPQKTFELLQYMSVIREAANKQGGLSWRIYDEQFRIRQAAFPSSWSTINSDLWLRVMSGPGQGVTSTAQINTVQPKKSACFDFNKGYCRWMPCKFDHCCSVCGQYSHGAWSCNQQGAMATMAAMPQIQRGIFR